ncbi:hypothetical protein GCM10009815_05350 [Nocardioides marmoribigeumensis]
MPRALREFAAVPLAVVVVLVVLAAASIIGDQAHGPFVRGLRTFLGHYIGKQTAADTLGAVATGLVTVTSITFSVLLLAVQQTASSLSPVVFDQFVRRRGNQLYLGLFVGLALYSYLVMAAVQPKTPPIIGAFVATALTVVALGCLLVLVYSTIDQMRPDNVMRQLHDRAVRARAHEGATVCRTRRRSTCSAPVRAEHRCPTFGYVESVDLDQLSGVLSDGQGEVEMRFTIGDEVVRGDLLAVVRHPEEATARRICEALPRAVQISPRPDIDVDPSTAVRDISNIGWSSGSTSKHNPAIAAQALHALRDLGSRWVAEGERAPASDAVAVVYPDRDVDDLLDALYSAAVVARESRQHQQAAKVLRTYRFLLDKATGDVLARLARDLEVLRAELDLLPRSPEVETERERLTAQLTRLEGLAPSH